MMRAERLRSLPMLDELNRARYSPRDLLLALAPPRRPSRPPCSDGRTGCFRNTDRAATVPKSRSSKRTDKEYPGSLISR